jgi:hypothetical protein
VLFFCVFALLHFEQSSQRTPACAQRIAFTVGARLSHSEQHLLSKKTPLQLRVFSIHCSGVYNSLNRLSFKSPHFHTHAHSFSVSAAIPISLQKHTGGVGTPSHSLAPPSVTREYNLRTFRMLSRSKRGVLAVRRGRRFIPRTPAVDQERGAALHSGRLQYSAAGDCHSRPGSASFRQRGVAPRHRSTL